MRPGRESVAHFDQAVLDGVKAVEHDDELRAQVQAEHGAVLLGPLPARMGMCLGGGEWQILITAGCNIRTTSCPRPLKRQNTR